jgi:hypothetical protein
MRQHTVNSLDNFIGGWYLDKLTLCDRILDYHKTMEKVEGGTYKGIVSGNEDVQSFDTNIKDSTDCILDGNTVLYTEYVEALQEVVNLYIEKYPKANAYEAFYIRQYVNIQRYNPNQGYHAWHTERACGRSPVLASRHLVFMTYLNDVTDDGETEFWHQKLKVKPEKGLTLIWPADWTFTHRGITSPTQTKYIVTGWFNFNH